MFFLNSKKLKEENERLNQQLLKMQQTNVYLDGQVKVKEDYEKRLFNVLSENEELKKCVEHLTKRQTELMDQHLVCENEIKILKEQLVQKDKMLEERVSMNSVVTDSSTVKDSEKKYMLQKNFSYKYTAAGVTKDGRQARVRVLQKGEKIRLVREKDNPHDPYAVALKNQYGSMLGYIPKKESEKIATLMDNSVKLFGYVAEVHGGYNPKVYYGFVVEVTNEKRSDSLLPNTNLTPYPKGDTSAILRESERRNWEDDFYDYHDDYRVLSEIGIETSETYDPDEDEWVTVRR